MPTLEKVLESCRKMSGTVYVELKSEDTDLTIDLVRSVGQLIKTLEFRNRSVVVSFDLNAIAGIKQLDASICTGALFAPTRNGRSFRSETMISAAIDCGANEMLLHRLLTRTKLVEKAIERSLSVIVWTVDDPNWLSRAAKLGISGVITNHPATLIKYRRSHAAIG